MDRKYEFSWGLLGDMESGRPNLGPLMRLEVYRLLQFTFRDVIEQQYGTEKADEVFYKAGRLAGAQFYQHVISDVADLNAFVKSLQEHFRDMGIGILRVEESDIEKGVFVFSVSEDLDCSGLPDTGYQICVYDEGFIAGLLESFSGKRFKVKETDCWCTGDRTCRFRAEVVD